MSHQQRLSKKALRTLRRNALGEDSIAMENPSYTPEVIHNVDTMGPHDWSIPEVNGTPVYIQSASEQMSCLETPNMEVSNISRRKHVTPGERQVLLGLRNETFYENSKNHATASKDAATPMTMEGVSGSEWPTQSGVINKGDIHIFVVLLL
jgi:hypothetical protein